MRKYKVWNYENYNRTEAERLAGELRVSPLVTGILLNRGLTARQEMQEFLFGNPTVYHDPFLMKDMETAAARILAAVSKQECITVYGDYDVDGITASSLLYLFLKGMGAKVNTYIPKRKGEGYGLNNEALQSIYASGTTLVVTVDCGISGLKEVAAAPEGMDIIITDHHTAPEELPAAYAIVNPKQRDCGYPFKGLSGVGVAYKLCQALHRLQSPKEELWEGLTELAALGTVADIVPLKGENRELVKRGLKAMETTSLLGLRELIRVSRCPVVNISSENIGFILAPRLNAVGRLEHAQRAVELLTTEDEAVAAEIAEELNQENSIRQEISHQIFVEAEEMLLQQARVDTAIVLAKEGWHAGVIGIVASRLVDKYHLPTILISIDGENSKGSCRSIPTLNLYEAINACSEDLLQFGGHHQAAGLTLLTSKLEDFKKHFRAQVAATLSPEDYQPCLKVDVVLDGEQPLDLSLLRQLQRLEPFGCENPVPIFAMKHGLIHNPKAVGKEQNHLRFFVDYRHESFHGIMWNGSHYMASLFNNAEMDLAFMPKLNSYMGTESVNLQIVAMDQQPEIYDYRQESEDKAQLLKKLLQTQDLVAIYINEGSSLPPELAAYSEARVKYYGQPQEPEEKLVVFYDLPITNIYGADSFPLQSGHNQTLVLLYNATDYRELRHKIEITYPDRRHLTMVYKYIYEAVKKQAVCNVEELKESAALRDIVVTDTDLAIFSELSFFVIQKGNISLGSIKKQALESSATYTRLRSLGQSLQNLCEENYKIPRARIHSLWRD